jgi:O-acetyl-ADP-ribose deacetylase (regulator of RNase III)
LKESENRNLMSIAIPALCTGIFGYPSKQATKVICEAIKNYFKDNQNSTVETVYLFCYTHLGDSSCIVH